MFLQRYRHELIRQVNSQECTRALENIKKTHPIFLVYPTAEALCGLLNPANKDYFDKDAVMIVLLTELKLNNAVYPLINLMFWGMLCSLYYRRRSRNPNPQELFNEIQWDFYQSVINHDLNRLPRKIVVNIFLNTKHKVTDWEKENRRYGQILDDFGEAIREGLPLADLDEEAVYPEEMESYLLDLVYRKVITQTQYDLFLETLVYKRMSPKEWAARRGVSHAAARILKHRAEKAITAFKKTNIF